MKQHLLALADRLAEESQRNLDEAKAVIHTESIFTSRMAAAFVLHSFSEIVIKFVEEARDAK